VRPSRSWIWCPLRSSPSASNASSSGKMVGTTLVFQTARRPRQGRLSADGRAHPERIIAAIARARSRPLTEICGKGVRRLTPADPDKGSPLPTLGFFSASTHSCPINSRAFHAGHPIWEGLSARPGPDEPCRRRIDISQITAFSRQALNNCGRPNFFFYGPQRSKFLFREQAIYLSVVSPADHPRRPRGANRLLVP